MNHGETLRVVRFCAFTVATTLMLVGCAAFQIGLQCSSYKNCWWKVTANDTSKGSGYSYLKLNIETYPELAKFIREKDSLPDYMYVANLDELRLLYMANRKIYTWDTASSAAGRIVKTDTLDQLSERDLDALPEVRTLIDKAHVESNITTGNKLAADVKGFTSKATSMIAADQVSAGKNSSKIDIVSTGNKNLTPEESMADDELLMKQQRLKAWASLASFMDGYVSICASNINALSTESLAVNEKELQLTPEQVIEWRNAYIATQTDASHADRVKCVPKSNAEIFEKKLTSKWENYKYIAGNEASSMLEEQLVKACCVAFCTTNGATLSYGVTARITPDEDAYPELGKPFVVFELWCMTTNGLITASSNTNNPPCFTPFYLLDNQALKEKFRRQAGPELFEVTKLLETLKQAQVKRLKAEAIQKAATAPPLGGYGKCLWGYSQAQVEALTSEEDMTPEQKPNDLSILGKLLTIGIQLPLASGSDISSYIRELPSGLSMRESSSSGKRIVYVFFDDKLATVMYFPPKEMETRGNEILQMLEGKYGALLRRVFTPVLTPQKKAEKNAFDQMNKQIDAAKYMPEQSQALHVGTNQMGTVIAKVDWVKYAGDYSKKQRAFRIKLAGNSYNEAMDPYLDEEQLKDQPKDGKSEAQVEFICYSSNELQGYAKKRTIQIDQEIKLHHDAEQQKKSQDLKDSL